MCLHRLDREVETGGDLFVPVAARDELEHLALAGREIVEFGVSAERLAGPEGVQDETGKPWREHRVSLGDTLDRTLELGARDRLGHIATGPRSDDADYVLGRI